MHFFPFNTLFFNPLKNGFMAGLVYFLIGISSNGQSQESIQTDRPTESFGASVVAMGGTQVEAGGWLQWATPVGEELADFSYALPIGTIRYGWKERLELRVGAQFSQTLGEAEQARFGIKWNILPESEQVQLVWLSELETSLSRGVSLETRAPSHHRLCAGWSDSKDWSALANVGFSADSDSVQWMASAVVSRRVGRQGWSAFAEPVLLGTGMQFNAGALLVLDDDAQIDFGYNRDITSGDYRILFGYSKRFAGKDKSAD